MSSVEKTNDTFDVGEDWGTPVSPTYTPPFAFTGTLKEVTVEASGSSEEQGAPAAIPDA